MTKIRVWRCFSVVMAMALILGVGVIAMPTEPARAQGETWNIQTVDDIRVNSTSLALDSHGYPHISYTTGFADSLHYAYWTGTAWAKETVDDGPAIVTSMVLDSNDLPYISYATGLPAFLHYAHWTGTVWMKETVDESDVWDCSIALDSVNRPHIAYATVGNTSLHYTYRTDQGWHNPDTVDESAVTSVSLALDSSDRPHISYATGGLTSLHYAHWTGIAWAKETVDEGAVISTSIALDSHGFPHISYATADLAGSLHYARWTGAAWAKETVDAADVSDCSLALDSHDLPHISYFVGIGRGPFLLIPDGGNHTVTGMLKYAHWMGSAWDIQTVDQETTTWAEPGGIYTAGILGNSKWSSIALDSFDLPHISYGNLVPSIITTSLHYASLIPPATSTVNTATGTGTATFTTSAGGIANLTAVDQTAITCDPSTFYFVQGLFSFNIVGLNPGATVTVTITLPSNMPVGTQYWKCINGRWVNVTSLLGDDDGDNILTLTITDGGLGDADGLANGTITDPGGPAVAGVRRIVPAQSAPRASPTLPTQLKPAQMSLQYLSLAPQQTSANQAVTITTNVVNTGDEAGNLSIALKINGLVEQTKMVSVGPQGTQPVKFIVTRAQPGTYTVDIGGQRGSFNILGAGSAAASKRDNVVVIVLLVFCILAIIAVAAVLLVRRPA